MPRQRTKNLFVVHTKSNDTHKRLYAGLSAALERIALSVWQYSDWKWRKDDRIERDWRFDEDALELTSEAEREVFGVESPRRIQGDVDQATLESLIVHTPAVLIFDVSDKELTAGVLEESKSIAKVFERLAPAGHFALVHFGTEGHFARHYPLHCGAVFELDISNGVRGTTVDRLALFALKVLVRKDMISRLWLGETSATATEALEEWVNKTALLISSCEFMTRMAPDLPMIELLEEVLFWTLCLVRKFGADSAWKQLPHVATWIESCFDSACSHTDLREEGLLNLIRSLRSLGARATHMLSEIQDKPLYCEGRGVQAVSWMALLESSRGLGTEQGRSAVESLIETARSSDVPDYMLGALLEGIGRVAEKEDPPERRRAAEFIRNLVEQGSLETSALGACLSAFGRAADRSDAPWLRAVLAEDPREPIRLKALLSLMRVIENEAEDVVLDFIRGASPAARRTIGSASWRIDTDRVYNAMLGIDPTDEKMRGVLLYALTRARNRRAVVQTLDYLGSESPYLRGIATAFLPELINRYHLSEAELRQLAAKLEGLLEDESDRTRFGSVLGLVRLSDRRHVFRADEVLRDCLRRGSTNRTRALLVEGALGLDNWPAPADARLLLFHPSPGVRGAMAFLAGHQQRSDLTEELRVLQRDPSDVPSFYSDRAMQDIGKTVEECATLALGRIGGHCPKADPAAW